MDPQRPSRSKDESVSFNIVAFKKKNLNNNNNNEKIYSAINLVCIQSIQRRLKYRR